MVSGQLRSVFRHPLVENTTAPTRELTFPASSVQQVPSGILFRVFATATMGHCTLSTTTATIGQLLLAATTSPHTAWTSTTMATSIYPAATFERAVLGSVVSKNQNNSVSGLLEPCLRALMNLHLRNYCKIVTYAKSPVPTDAGDFVQYAEC